MAVEFGLLGEVTAHVGGRPVDLGPARQRCVLAVLAVDVGRLVSAERLVERVWGAETPRRGRATLHSHISRLRRALAVADAAEIVLRSGGYALVVNRADEAVDLHRFRDLCARARAADDQRAAALLEEALGLWRGEALTGLDGEWVAVERDRLRQERLSAEHDLTDVLLRLGHGEDLLADLSAREARWPLDERVAGQYMLALHRAGRTADALVHYRRLRERLVEELGTDPGTALQDLHRQILATDPALTAVSASARHLTGEWTPPSAPATPPVPNSLPRDIPDFTGREHELDELITAVERAEGDGATAIAIHAIDGMPGVGKTALGTHAAHKLAPRFPDGQLFLGLHGHTPGQKPLAPHDALHSLLLAIGVHPDVLNNHKTVDDRARLWRTLVADRKLLLVLDDAATHDQINPLLPAAPGCLVLITSRNRLPELDGVRPLTVTVLSRDDATRMLLRLARRAPDPGEAEDVTRVVELCGNLPLAIAITASQLRAHPTWSVRNLADLLADQLAQADDKLGELEYGGRSVKAAFDMSFRDLPVDQREMFTLLGVHHGPEIDARAAAALSDTTPARARRALDALHTRHLVQETSPGRYRLHDLLRAYANTHAAHMDPDHHQRATTRVLDYYLHTAHTATRHLPAHRTPGTPVTPTAPAHPTPITDTDHALTWLTTELRTLATAIDHTHATHPAHTVHLSTTLNPYFRTAGQWQHARTIHHTALTTATRTGDPRTQATALNDLGYVYERRGDLDAAVDAQTRAAELFTSSGDLLGQGNALNNLGRVYERRGDLDAAERAQTRALDLFSRSGDLLGQGNALNNLGRVYDRRGDLDAAERAQTRALELFTRIGSLVGQGNVLNNLGYVFERRGDLGAAVDAQTRALELFTRSGDLLGQGNVLNNLSYVYERRGDLDAAVDAQTRAAELFTSSGDLLGQGNALNNLGRVYERRGDLDAAVDAQTRALELFTRSGSLLGQANACLGIGIAHHRKHDLDTAADSLTRALHLFTRAEDPDGQAETHNALGDLVLDRPDAGEAHTHYTTALTLARACGSRLHEANALVGQAQCLHRTGNTSEAISLLQQALTIHRDINAPETTHTAHLLAALDPTGRTRENHAHR
ncbi:AfsR/SARP family transcriptional regulator [Saccharothrix deserti]|uniref:AfsR/SARP family transcriptional regulator n=1 Tax=Saccharothrix deserti TaxID=2593674 RepID=UPI00131AF287|nr:tetratricopeptide repeat protein [Saccharothrix deserti]